MIISNFFTRKKPESQHDLNNKDQVTKDLERDIDIERSVPNDIKQIFFKEYEKERSEPLKLIGSGQTGVGKTTLIRSIFRISQNQTPPETLKVGNIDPVTMKFQTVEIIKDGFILQLTDGPGLGGTFDEMEEEELIKQWIQEIPKHDLLYWVIDASSRDYYHVFRNLKRILDETKFYDKTIIIINKVDDIFLFDEEKSDKKVWITKDNHPAPELQQVIELKVTKISEHFARKLGIQKEQIIPCSALKGYKVGSVFDAMVKLVPKEKRIKMYKGVEIKER